MDVDGPGWGTFLSLSWISGKNNNTELLLEAGTEKKHLKHN
jgi:hypothetical protein